jgi:integrase/recombinase XerD
MKEKFLEDVRAGNRSEGTINALEVGLDFLIRFLETEARVMDVRDIKESHIFAFADYVKNVYKKADGKELAQRTKQFMIYMIARFCAFLEREEYIFMNPARALEFEKPGKTLPRIILTEEETRAFLNTPNLKTPYGRRNRAIFEILYGSALRNNEVRILRFQDIDLDNRYLFVKGKGSKDRVVPMTGIAKRFLKTYLEKVRPLFCKNTGDEAVFLTQFGKPLKGYDINVIIRQAAKKAGLNKPVTAHTLRHTCASHLIARGASVRYVQELLGHEKVSTTQIYTHVRPVDLQKVYNETHPRCLKLQGLKPVEDGEN